jgi:hypothetical protein
VFAVLDKVFTPLALGTETPNDGDSVATASAGNVVDTVPESR